MNGKEGDYTAWTADVFFDQPMGVGALTAEAAYIAIRRTPNGITWTQCASGDDASVIAAKLGYLISDAIGPGQIQPFAHFELVDVDEQGKDDTKIYGLGLNYLIKGHANKISLDVSYMDQGDEIDNGAVQDRVLFTFQIAAGF